MMEEMWVPHASQEEGKRERSMGREAVPSKERPQWPPPTARPYSQQVIQLQAPEEAGFLRVTSQGSTSVHGCMEDHMFSAWVFMELEWDFLSKPQRLTPKMKILKVFVVWLPSCKVVIFLSYH